MTVEKLIAHIEHEISLNGGNRHQYPLTFGKANGKWSVVVEVNSKARTFDVETEGPTLATALHSALTAIKRQYANPGR